MLTEHHQPRIDPKTGYPAAPREGFYRDWYLFTYGDDYATGLADFRRLCGAIPMPPRWALGSWFSIFAEWDEAAQRRLVENYRAHDLPLDVLMIDLIWHTEPNLWEGWDWNRKLFPDPEAFIGWLHERGVHLGLNLHPLGCDDRNRSFPALVAELGPARGMAIANNVAVVPWEAQDDGHKRVIPDIAKPAEAELYCRHLLAPLLRQGVDVLWLDGTAHATGVDPQLWSNHVFTRYAESATGRRPVILSRAGGIGSHRYPVQFSGDTWSHWEVLAHEVDITARAGNVGMAWWSHDIGGFNGSAPFRTTPGDHTFRGLTRLDPELFVRWVQFGCLSPVFRLHSHHGAREPWEYEPTACAAMRRALQLRRSLVPYLYHLAKETQETGLPLCRPLYLHWPREEEAYRHPHEYLLGERLLVSPVVESGGVKRTWFPPGNWISLVNGETVQGPGELLDVYALDEIPLWLRAGSVLPMQDAGPTVGPASPAALTLLVAPGGNDQFRFYENDGESLSGNGARTPVRVADDGRTLTFAVAAVEGSFAGQPQSRSWSIEVVGWQRPTVARLDGAALPCRVAGQRLFAHVPERPLDRGWELTLQRSAAIGNF